MSTQQTIEKPTKNLVAKKKNKIKKEKKVKTIASVAQGKLERLEKQEKTLKAIIEKRTAYIAKLQGNLDNLNEKLKKVQAQKTAELKSIQSLVEVFKNA
jgi:uncharacterized coiled-coil protein SlyX